MSGKNYTLITGSNGGLGLYVTEFLLQQGVRELICQYRDSKTNIEALLQRYELSTADCLVQAELSDEKSVASMHDQIVSRNSNVSKIVNIAGSSTNGMSWKLSVEDFKKALDDNLLSTFLTCRQFIPKMREQGFGRIINTSSIVAFSGIAGASHYSAAKAGIIGLTKSMSLELANKNITCNSLALGYFDTGLINGVPPNIQDDIKKKIPLGRFGGAQDIGSIVNYLLSDQSGFITGQVFHINGGQL